MGTACAWFTYMLAGMWKFITIKTDREAGRQTVIGLSAPQPFLIRHPP